MAKERILVVEDEEDILELVRYNLVKEGYQVETMTTGEGVQAAVRARAPDLIILDLMLPGIDGLEVCKLLKRDERTAKVPVVMLTAKSEDPDIVAGLELGADDYVTKPFSPKVLIARVRAVLRRATAEPQPTPTVLRAHDLTIDTARHEVLVRGKPVDLTPTEFSILHFLCSQPGWVFTRNQIIGAVKGNDYPVTERSVDVQVVGLRKKLGEAGQYIETVRGVGYRFKE